MPELIAAKPGPPVQHSVAVDAGWFAAGWDATVLAMQLSMLSNWYRHTKVFGSHQVLTHRT